MVGCLDSLKGRIERRHSSRAPPGGQARPLSAHDPIQRARPFRLARLGRARFNFPRARRPYGRARGTFQARATPDHGAMHGAPRCAHKRAMQRKSARSLRACTTPSRALGAMRVARDSMCRAHDHIPRARPFRLARPGRAGLLIPRPRPFRRGRLCPAESHLSRLIPLNPGESRLEISCCPHPARRRS